MNIFSKIPQYGGNYEVKESRKFDQEELNAIKSARVVDSQYGMSVCFMLVNGNKAYIPVGRDCNPMVGDSVDPAAVTLLTLGRAGDEDIQRVEW